MSQHVTDRVDLRAAVEDRINSIGELQIILGGQSIGKTNLLRNICADYSTRSDIGVSDSMPIMVIYVNARRTSLIEGLTAALKDYAEKGWFDTMIEADWDTISAVSAAVAGTPPAALGVAFLGAIASLSGLVDSVCGSSLDDDSKEIKLLKLLQAVAEKAKERPCLVIDQANIVLNGQEQSKKLLNMICSATKEEQWLNVVLCSSIHSYPQQLAAIRGINLHLVPVVHASELSPKAMWRCLTQEKVPETDEPLIGMGDSFAAACISLFGGNIAVIQSCLSQLIKRKKLSVHTILDGLEGANSIHALLNDKNDHRAENKNMLKMLAENGFAIVKKDSAQVTEFINANVACLVKANQLVDGPLADQIQKSDLKNALLPSSEALRHVILLALQQENDAK
jgi:hypothetical protein